MQKLDSLDRGKEGAVTWNPVDAPWNLEAVPVIMSCSVYY
jgi:hypothetical protein